MSVDREDVTPEGTGEAGAPEPKGAGDINLGKTPDQRLNIEADKAARKGLDEERGDDNQIFSK